MLTAIEIIVLIIGFLAVCISFFVGNNAKTDANKPCGCAE